MNLVSLFLNRSDLNVNKLPKPWNADRPAIYGFIKEYLGSAQEGLFNEVPQLPDDDVFYRGKKLRFASGGLDGIMGHHGSKGKQAELASKVHRLVRKIIMKPNRKNMIVFYELITKDETLSFIDELIILIGKDKILNFARLQQFAQWVAKEAPDRGAVKLAIALLGIFRGEQNTDIFETLGHHEEFTLYAVVALGNTLAEPELTLWNLAQKVDGWGRIHIVERLRKTQNEAIKHWMLRDGFRNTIMYEYLAYTCAMTGGLFVALEQPELDGALFEGAGDIIDALLRGGPAESMMDYEDGAAATLLYLDHATKRNLDLGHFLIVQSIHDYIQRDNVKQIQARQPGWTDDIVAEIREKTSLILNRLEWKERALTALGTKILLPEYGPFHTASQVAEKLGIDTWDYYFQRQKSGAGEEWHFLMQTTDGERIDKVIALAEALIPLEEIATGPSTELGLGQKFKHHRALDFILQELKDFPGKGWNIIKAALSSPTVRNRHLAVRALTTWGKMYWTDEIVNRIQEAFQKEPDPKVKLAIQTALEAQ